MGVIKMSKKRKIQLGIILTCIIALIAFLLFYIGSMIFDYYKLREKSEQTVTEFNELYEQEGKQVILFASPYCHFCQEFKPILEEISKEKSFSFYYFNTSSVLGKEMEKIIDKLELNIKGVPHLIVIENKKLLGEQSGKKSKEETIKYLEKVGMIKEEVAE